LLAALAGFFVGFAIWFHVTTKVIQTAYFQQFAIVFLTGAMFALIERIRCAKTAIVSTIGIAAITAITTSAVAILPAIAVAAILTGKAQFPIWLRPPVDVSYGVYLYAFPMQQLIVSYGFSFAIPLAVALCMTMALAVLSALFIERPLLQNTHSSSRPSTFAAANG
jgi:hypothetical protein